MAKKWQNLLDRHLTPEQQAAVRERALAEIAAMPLAELRKARELTQETMAELMERDQSSVSALEKRTDAYVSTLRRYIEAMGGELQVVARFPEGDIVIDQFAEV